MPFPLFPMMAGAPGDGQRLVLVTGDPPSTHVIGGIVEHLEAIDARAPAGLNLAVPEGRFGQPLHPEGTTIWLRGRLQLDLAGRPDAADYRELLDAWVALRDRLWSGEPYELRLYSAALPAPLHYAYTGLHTVCLHSYWHHSAGMEYRLGAFTTETTLIVVDESE